MHTGMTVMSATATVPGRSTVYLSTFRCFGKLALVRLPGSSKSSANISRCIPLTSSPLEMERNRIGTRLLVASSSLSTSSSLALANTSRFVLSEPSPRSRVAVDSLGAEQRENELASSRFLRSQMPGPLYAASAWRGRLSSSPRASESGNENSMKRSWSERGAVHRGREIHCQCGMNGEELNQPSISSSLDSLDSSVTERTDADLGSRETLKTNGIVARKTGIEVESNGAKRRKEEAGEKKRTTFELWAVKKLKEEGLAALSVIEEMRQTFSPDSQSLDSNVLLTECELRELNSLSSSGKSQKTLLEPSHGAQATTSAGSDADSAKDASNSTTEDRKHSTREDESRIYRRVHVQGNAEVATRSGVEIQSEYSNSKTTSRLHTKKKAFSSTIAHVESLSSRVPFQRSYGAKATEESSNTTTQEVQLDPTIPKPFLLKRSSTLPHNWNGLGGTVVLIDKPKGWTSFAVCGKLRHTVKIQKVGHAGTLDPMATGLLIVCLGKATKLASNYQALTKVYSGTFRLGELTPSLDADTEVTNVLPWEHIQDEDIQKAKEAFTGDILQSPPMFSAIKIDGERLYKKARRGEEIEIPPRLVTVNDFHLERNPHNRQDVNFIVTCSKGTYIRSLCADLGRALGSYAHLTALRREKIGSYSVADAWPVMDLVTAYHEVSGNPTIRR